MQKHKKGMRMTEKVCLKTRALNVLNEPSTTSILQPVQVQLSSHIWYKTRPRNSLWPCDIYLSSANRSSGTDAWADNDQYRCDGWPDCYRKRTRWKLPNSWNKRQICIYTSGSPREMSGKAVCQYWSNQWINPFWLVRLLITWALCRQYILLTQETNKWCSSSRLDWHIASTWDGVMLWVSVSRSYVSKGPL